MTVEECAICMDQRFEHRFITCMNNKCQKRICERCVFKSDKDSKSFKKKCPFCRQYAILDIFFVPKHGDVVSDTIERTSISQITHNIIDSFVEFLNGNTEVREDSQE